MFATTKELVAIKGISDAKVAKLKEMGGCRSLRFRVLGAAADRPRAPPLLLLLHGRCCHAQPAIAAAACITLPHRPRPADPAPPTAPRPTAPALWQLPRSSRRASPRRSRSWSSGRS